MKWKVVPPFISMEALGWWVSTKSRRMKGGVIAPHHPFPLVVEPRNHARGPNLLRPMISAPMPEPQLLAKRSSTPSLPLTRHSSGEMWVVKNRSMSRSPACPKGACRLWPSPVSETVERDRKVVDPDT